jgi:uncharacterized protein YjgD (DUF1641 family)
MDPKAMEQRMDAIEAKLDLLLDHVEQQRLRNEQVNDLVSDVSVIGKDIYQSTVEELDKYRVTLDADELKYLGIKLARNIGRFRTALETFESAFDLMNEAGPIVNEVLIDTVKKFHEFEQKGYFEFIREAGGILENVMDNFSKNDVKALADNIVTILETVKNLTQPDMMLAVDNAMNVYKSLDTKDAPSYSVWRVMRELNSPEMKKGIGFMITFMKNMAALNENQPKQPIQ